jgi:hypothetical protein
VVSGPIGADDAFFAATDALGEVAAIVAPNTGHDLGLAPWHARYPAATLYAPAVAAPQIEKAKKVGPIRPLGELHTGAGTRFLDVPGTKSGMTMFSVEAGEKRVTFTDELVMFGPMAGPAPARFVFWLAGSGGEGVRLNKLWTMVFAKDKREVARAVAAELEAHPPTTLVLGHGPVLEDVGAARAAVAGVAG